MQLPVDLAVQLHSAIAFYQIPLVVGDHQRPPGLDYRRHDPQILLGERLARVDQHDGYLGPLQRTLGAQRREVVGTLRLECPPPDPGRVDEPPGLAAQLNQLVDGVPGRARDLVDQHPLLPGQLVEQARLAHVGPADQRDAARPGFRSQVLSRRGRQRTEDRVKQVTAATAVQRADRVRLTEAQ